MCAWLNLLRDLGCSGYVLAAWNYYQITFVSDVAELLCLAEGVLFKHDSVDFVSPASGHQDFEVGHLLLGGQGVEVNLYKDQHWSMSCHNAVTMVHPRNRVRIVDLLVSSLHLLFKLCTCSFAQFLHTTFVHTKKQLLKCFRVFIVLGYAWRLHIVGQVYSDVIT